MIQGYTGQLDMWFARNPFQPTVIEAFDALFASGSCPDAIVVFVDAWTSYGGSQFLNSTSTGRYMDYLCDEVVEFVDARYPTAADRDHRGLAGKSSGGYGAMVVPMLRPDVFGALASHAGDALFEAAYLPEFPSFVRTMRDRFEGSIEVFFEQIAALDALRPGPLPRDRVLRLRGRLLARPGAARQGAAARRPRDGPADRRRVGAVAGEGPGADGARPRRRAALDAPDLPRRRDAATSTSSTSARPRSGPSSTSSASSTRVELFDGKHGGIAWRYPGAIRELVLALT